MAVTTTKHTIVRGPKAALAAANAASVVVSFAFDAQSKPVWGFSPDPIEMAYGNDTINFTLNTTTGLVFDDWFAPPSAQNASFSWQRDATKTVLTVTDTNTNPAGSATVHIPYKVAVVDPNNPGRRYVSDPIIDNDPDAPPME